MVNKETKSERFERIAIRRTAHALDAVRKLFALANRNSYEYRPEHTAAIIDALRKQITDLESRFEMPRRGNEFKFN